MERLTDEMSKGNYGVLNCGAKCKYDNKYCYTHNCPEIEKVIQKLGEYERLEENGLIIRLPCKVGDTVYSVSFRKKCMGERGYITNQDIDCAICGYQDFCRSKKEWFIEEITVTLPIIANIIHHKNNESDDFSIYLTREEAERKLKEMEASENAERKY